MKRWMLFICVLLLGGGQPLRAQRPPADKVPLEVFVQQVTHLWSQGDVGGLMELVPDTGLVVLDLGSGGEAVSSRHAAAALRALFAEREQVAARPVRVTVAGGSPPRGFGELSWTYRSRGAPAPQTRAVFVGALWDGGRWRVSELRILP